MQNAGISSLGLNWRYLAFDVDPDDLKPAIDGAKAMKFIGLNLTVPHKILALEMVDALDESAQTWGAVNTIRFEGLTDHQGWQPIGRLHPDEIIDLRSVGFNTDADAITRSLQEDLSVTLPGATVLLLGAGGAGRTAALKLATEGVSALYLVNRTRAKAEEILAEINQRFPQVQAAIGYPEDGVDLLLNATSLGLKAGDPMPIDDQHFPLGRASAVYDMIYRPAETELLRRAKASGCRTANGLGMLLYQGVKALEIWSGKSAPIGIMRQALTKNIYG